MLDIGQVREIVGMMVEVADEGGPYGAKGRGESVLTPSARAVLNGMRDAAGDIVRDTPATPGRVLWAIRSAGLRRDG